MYTGIDVGLKTTCLVSLDNAGKLVSVSEFGSEVTKKLKEAIPSHPSYRYGLYRSYFKSYLDEYTIGTVIMEQPMGSFGGNSIKLAELYGIYVVTLYDYIPLEKIFLVKPTEIKKAFTGSGASNKDHMILQCKLRGFTPSSEHMADAIGAAFMGVEGKLKH